MKKPLNSIDLLLVKKDQEINCNSEVHVLFRNTSKHPNPRRDAVIAVLKEKRIRKYYHQVISRLRFSSHTAKILHINQSDLSI